MGTRMDGIRYLSGVPLFVGLAPKALAGLAAHTRLVSFSAGDTVVEMDAGTPLFVVLDGHVRITDAAAGSSLTPILLGPGECFGDRALLNGEPCRASVEASEDVRLLMIEQKDLHELVAHFPEVAVQIFENLSLQMGRADELIRDILNGFPLVRSGEEIIGLDRSILRAFRFRNERGERRCQSEPKNVGCLLRYNKVT